VKDSTKDNWRLAKGNLLTFFGRDKLITDITVADAKDSERFLKTGDARQLGHHEKTANDGLGEETAHKRICHAKQFFQDAVERELIVKNPFAGLKSSVHGNSDRFFFVTREMADKVLHPASRFE